MLTQDEVIAKTRKWISDVVIGCNFCPFAGNVVKKNVVHYVVEGSTQLKACLETFIRECQRLQDEEAIETTIIILSEGFKKFEDYMDLVSLAEELLKKEGYEGIYQVASFHPEFKFAGAPLNDPANYTNRSMFPMLHILREKSIEKALKNYADPDEIPDRNINFAREKGLVYMKMLRDDCM